MTTFKARSYGFLLWSDRLIQVKTIEIPSLGLCKRWPRPLNRGDRLIEVTFRVIKRINFRDFYNWPLNRGWPFNTGPLNTGYRLLFEFCHLLQIIWTTIQCNFLKAIPKIFKRLFSTLSVVESTWNLNHLLALEWNLLLLLFWKNQYFHDNGKQQILKS